MYSALRTCSALLLCAALSPVFGQTFTPLSTNLEPLYRGNIVWNDLDVDGDLDLLYSGLSDGGNEFKTLVYENVSGSFVIHTTSLPAMRNGDIALGDYDNDGDPDVLMSGLGLSGNFSALYKNNGNFNFVLATSFPGILNSTATWADIDNDEDIDLMLSGVDDNTGTSDPFIDKTFLYRNDGATFTLLPDTQLPPCSQCATDWADVNADGHVDMVITTVSKNGQRLTELYVNNGDYTFTLDETQDLSPLFNGDVRWGDLDRDGRMDLLLSGVRDDGTIATEVYQNDNGHLVRSDITDFRTVGENWNRGTRWVDYNNDGWQDIILSGRGTSVVDLEYVFKGYINNGDSTFTEEDFGIDGLSDGSIDVGDFDNDGDLDIAYMGMSSLGATAGILLNTLKSSSFVANTKPLPPAVAGLSATTFRSQLHLRWPDGSDTQTPTDGLNYNFWLQQGSTKLIVPNANRTTGFVTTNNVPNGHARRIQLPDLAEGSYTWGVQSIDGARAGSVFTAPKALYKLNGPEAVKAEIVDETHVKLTWIDHSAMETSYRIERSTDPNTGYATQATVAANATTFTDNFAFVTETTYYYRVYASNVSGSSGYDSLQVIVPAAPENPFGRLVQAARIALSWDDMSNYETAFEIEGKPASSGSFSVLATVGADVQEFSSAGLTEGTGYQYRVRAKNEYGYSAYSSPVTISTNFRPRGADLAKAGTEDENIAFTTDEFVTKFTDQDVDDFFQSIFVATLPVRGTLKLATATVVAGQQILRGDLSGLSYVPAANDNGLTSFDFYYSDGKDSSNVAHHVNINIAPVNDAPVFTIPERVDLEEDFAPITLVPEMSIPADEQSQPITWTIAPAEVDGINMAFDAATGALALSPVENAFGQWQFTITADDGQSEHNSHSTTVDVIVRSVNDAPVIAFIEDIAVEKAQPIPSVTLVVTDADNALTDISFGVTSDNQAVIKNSNLHINGMVLSITPELKVGKAVINVRATDGISIGTREFTLEILTITDVEEFVSGVSVYPNPVERELLIAVDQNFTPPFQIVVRDALGREVVNQVIEGHSSQVDFGDLRSGMYFLKVLSPKHDVLYQSKVSHR